MFISFLKERVIYIQENFENKTSSTESLSFQKDPGTRVQGHKLKKKKKKMKIVFFALLIV